MPHYQIGQRVPIVVERQGGEPNFDRACDSAARRACSLFGVDDDGHFHNVILAERGWARVVVEFDAYRLEGGVCVYQFVAWVEQTTDEDDEEDDDGDDDEGDDLGDLPELPAEDIPAPISDELRAEATHSLQKARQIVAWLDTALAPGNRALPENVATLSLAIIRAFWVIGPEQQRPPQFDAIASLIENLRANGISYAILETCLAGLERRFAQGEPAPLGVMSQAAREVARRLRAIDRV